MGAEVEGACRAGSSLVQLRPPSQIHWTCSFSRKPQGPLMVLSCRCAARGAVGDGDEVPVQGTVRRRSND
jgi:hypothetical protein